MRIKSLFPYKIKNKESLCDSLRARVGTQVHLQLHTGRIPAEHFYFIGKEISYKVKKDQLPSRIIGLFLNVLCQRTMRTRDSLILPGFIRKRMA